MKPTLESATAALGVLAKEKLANPTADGQYEDQLCAPLEGLIKGLAEACRPERASAESAPGKAWVRRTTCESVTETLRRNPAGQPRPAKAGDQPEPSAAWYGGYPGCEAYTGSVQAV